MYRYEVSKKDIKLIKEALKIITDLKAPISKKITFGYTNDKSVYGYCSQRGVRDYVMFHPDFINDYYKMNTIIHEILHTIDNGWDTPHRGEWAKWAKIVSNVSNYKIEIHGDSHELKYEDKNVPIPMRYVHRNVPTKKVYCPSCGRAYDIPRKGRSYWCPRCIKPLSKTPQSDELSKLSIKERQNEILLRMHDLNIETAPKLLLYANKINTRKIIINLMLTHPLDNKLKTVIGPYIDVHTRHRITELCDKGAFNKFITSFTNMYNYENISDTKVDLFKVLLGF